MSNKTDDPRIKADLLAIASSPDNIVKSTHNDHHSIRMETRVARNHSDPGDQAFQAKDRQWKDAMMETAIVSISNDPNIAAKTVAALLHALRMSDETDKVLDAHLDVVANLIGRTQVPQRNCEGGNRCCKGIASQA